MSYVRQLGLSEQHSFIQYPNYPDAGGCHILCLSDRQLHVIDHMIFPLAMWRTRFVRFVRPGVYETCGDAQLITEHLEEMEDLEDQIGGSSMGCSELAQAITDLATSLSAGGSGAGTTTVNCGSGCGSGVAGSAGGLISGLTNEELMGPDPMTQPAAGGDPPAGFETWEAYRLQKCRGAHYVFDSMVRSFNMLNTLSGTLGTLATVTPMIMYYIAATSVVAPVVDVIAIALAVIPFLVLCIGAAYSTASAVAYLETNKDSIICALYLSGSAQAAIEVAADAIEDAAEAVEWGGALSGLGGVLAPALGAAASSAISTNVANAIFHVVEDVLYPDVTCTCGGGTLLQTGGAGVANTLVIGDSVSSGLTDATNGYQVLSPSSRNMFFTPFESCTSIRLEMEYHHIQNNWTVVDAQIKRVSDSQGMCDFQVPNSNEGWRSVGNTQNCNLVGGVQYRLELIPEGGNSVWVRYVDLEGFLSA